MFDGIGGRSLPKDARLPPLHGHTQGQGGQDCDSADCGRPLRLPSLSALGIADTAMASVERASSQTQLGGSEASGTSALAAAEAEQRCLWSTCTQIFNSIDELVRHLYKLHVATNRTPSHAGELPALTAEFLCRWASCGTRAHDTEELIDHVCKDHLDAAQVQHRCGWTGCSQEHATISGLTEHLSTVHIGAGR
ncbi:hypothetical protein IWW36_004746, partial [Coemansia brasiliensis]